MAGLITEISRFRPFRLFSVTEIILSPYGGRIVPAIITGGYHCPLLGLEQQPRQRG